MSAADEPSGANQVEHAAEDEFDVWDGVGTRQTDATNKGLADPPTGVIEPASAAIAPITFADLTTHEANLAAQRVISAYDKPPAETGPLADVPSPSPAAVDEWDAVNEFREKVAQEDAERQARSGAAALRPKDRWTPIGYIEARSALMDLVRDPNPSIQRYDFRQLSWFTRMRYQLCGPPEFRSELMRKERDAVFYMALQQLDTSVEVHERIIQTVYRRLAGQTEPCPRYGSHWEVVGFQGNDPGTDLRGSGMFGLLQIVAFLKSSATLLTRIFALSRDERQSFPFAVVSLNFTGICLRVLREARLYWLCAKRDSVVDTMCTLHQALFYDMFLTWKNQAKTIEAFPAIRDDLERRARSDPDKIIALYEKNNVSPLDALTSPEEFVPQSS